MNSLADLQEQLRRRQMQLTLPYLEPLDMYNSRNFHCLDTQKNLLSPSSHGSSILGNALGFVSSPLSLLPASTTRATGSAAAVKQSDSSIALLNNHHRILVASRAQQQLGLSNSTVFQQKLELLSQLGGQLSVGRASSSSLPLTKLQTTSTPIPGRVEPFPEKLHRLLIEVEVMGRPDIISFIDDDTFRIHNQETFFREIVPRYFRQTKLTSFKRQLKLYGFALIAHGPNKGGYRHRLFSKKDAEKCRSMKRVAIKTPKSSLVSSSKGGNK